MTDYIITGKALERWDLPLIITSGEIVRCRDCANCEEHAVCGKLVLFCHHFSMCDSAGFPVEPDGFCAWGEREEQ